MPDRSGDWYRQAVRDLDEARDAASNSRHEWACFAAHQSAEKAVNALHLSRGQEAWGHVVRTLLEELPSSVSVPADLADKARVLDAARLPVPADLIVYTEDELEEVLSRGDRFARVLRDETVWFSRSA